MKTKRTQQKDLTAMHVMKIILATQEPHTQTSVLKQVQVLSTTILLQVFNIVSQQPAISPYLVLFIFATQFVE